MTAADRQRVRLELDRLARIKARANRPEPGDHCMCENSKCRREFTAKQSSQRFCSERCRKNEYLRNWRTTPQSV